jgi:hypothetical protein
VVAEVQELAEEIAEPVGQTLEASAARRAKRKKAELEAPPPAPPAGQVVTGVPGTARDAARRRFVESLEAYLFELGF